MKTFLFSVAMLLVTMLGFSTKADAQVNLHNDLPCPMTYIVDFGPPCGVVVMTVPPNTTIPNVGAGCGPARKITVTDGTNSYTGDAATGWIPQPMPYSLCGLLPVGITMGPGHAHTHP